MVYGKSYHEPFAFVRDIFFFLILLSHDLSVSGLGYYHGNIDVISYHNRAYILATEPKMNKNLFFFFFWVVFWGMCVRAVCLSICDGMGGRRPSSDSCVRLWQRQKFNFAGTSIKHNCLRNIYLVISANMFQTKLI